MKWNATLALYANVRMFIELCLTPCDCGCEWKGLKMFERIRYTLVFPKTKILCGWKAPLAEKYEIIIIKKKKDQWAKIGIPSGSERLYPERDGDVEDGKNRRRIKLKTGERGGKEKTGMTATDKLGASWMLWIPFDPSVRREEVGVTRVYYRATDKEGRKEGSIPILLTVPPSTFIRPWMKTRCASCRKRSSCSFFFLLLQVRLKRLVEIYTNPKFIHRKVFWVSIVTQSETFLLRHLSGRECKHPTLSASAPWWPGVGLFALPGSDTQLAAGDDSRCIFSLF